MRKQQKGTKDQYLVFVEFVEFKGCQDYIINHEHLHIPLCFALPGSMTFGRVR
jgi:hypothetical protein